MRKFSTEDFRARRKNRRQYSELKKGYRYLEENPDTAVYGLSEDVTIGVRKNGDFAKSEIKVDGRSKTYDEFVAVGLKAEDGKITVPNGALSEELSLDQFVYRSLIKAQKALGVEVFKTKNQLESLVSFKYSEDAQDGLGVVIHYKYGGDEERRENYQRLVASVLSFWKRSKLLDKQYTPKFAPPAPSQSTQADAPDAGPGAPDQPAQGQGHTPTLDAYLDLTPPQAQA